MLSDSANCFPIHPKRNLKTLNKKTIKYECPIQSIAANDTPFRKKKNLLLTTFSPPYCKIMNPRFFPLSYGPRASRAFFQNFKFNSWAVLQNTARQIDQSQGVYHLRDIIFIIWLLRAFYSKTIEKIPV